MERCDPKNEVYINYSNDVRNLYSLAWAIRLFGFLSCRLAQRWRNHSIYLRIYWYLLDAAVLKYTHKPNIPIHWIAYLQSKPHFIITLRLLSENEMKKE